jgi:hypothetical protein
MRLARDPFVADAQPVVTDLIAGLPVLPANRGIGAGVAEAEPAVRVEAIVTGRHAFGLVVYGQQTLVVKPGDVLLGKRVVAIEIGGILLSGGRRLHVQ